MLIHGNAMLTCGNMREAEPEGRKATELGEEDDDDEDEEAGGNWPAFLSSPAAGTRQAVSFRAKRSEVEGPFRGVN